VVHEVENEKIKHAVKRIYNLQLWSPMTSGYEKIITKVEKVVAECWKKNHQS
jgi:hypothetical protein